MSDTLNTDNVLTRSRKMKFGATSHIIVLACICVLSTSTPTYAERILFVNFTTAQLVILDGDKTIFSTGVVLPQKDYYTLPVSGTVARAITGPIWTPTPAMHREYPGRYKEQYEPYEAGNAMGHCKLYINFVSNDPILNVVRIHGNARLRDLGERLSRSCIRIPDTRCEELVLAVQEVDSPVKVHFYRQCTKHTSHIDTCP